MVRIKETITFCGKDENNRYIHFFTSEFGVKFCGHEEAFRVKITECNNEGNSTHWSWWDNSDQEFKFTHYMKEGVSICFPCGTKVMEEYGEGKLLPVTIELV